MNTLRPAAAVRHTLSAALFVLTLVGTGCQSARLTRAYTQARPLAALTATQPGHAPAPAYRVAAPDTLHITVLRAGQTTDHHVTLPPDGRLLLPGPVAPVRAAGLTPEQIATALERGLTNPEDAGPREHTAPDRGPRANLGLTLRTTHPESVHVAVRVARFASRQVYVLGQVQEPGAQPWNGHNQLLTALVAARPGPRADLHRVLILRPGPDGQPRRWLASTKRPRITGADTPRNPRLAPGDIVFVPATTLGRLGLALDRLAPGPRAAVERIGQRPAPFFPAPAFAHHRDGAPRRADAADRAAVTPAGNDAPLMHIRADTAPTPHPATASVRFWAP